MRRYFTFFNRALQLSRLGNRYRDRFQIFATYIALSMRRLLGLTYAEFPLRHVELRYKGKVTPFFYRGLLDFYILEGLFVEEEYETHPLTEPRIIFDLGSNTGVSVLYLKLRHPNAKIFAFEPDPKNIAVLRENTEWFKDDLTVFEGAVSDVSNPSADFYIGKEHWSSSLAERIVSDHSIKVEMITLDDAMKHYGVSEIDLMKFDIEGAEYDVFKVFGGLSHVHQLVGEVHLDMLGAKVQGFWELFKDFNIERRPVHYQRLTAVFNRP